VKADERSEEVIKDLERISPVSDERGQPLLKDEVHKVIHKLKKSGSDGIVGEILELQAGALEEEIFSIMKSVWMRRRHQRNGPSPLSQTSKKVTRESVATIGQPDL